VEYIFESTQVAVWPSQFFGKSSTGESERGGEKISLISTQSNTLYYENTIQLPYITQT
jgi:hypothetical protein